MIHLSSEIPDFFQSIGMKTAWNRNEREDDGFNTSLSFGLI